MAVAVCAAAVEDERGAGKSAAGGFRESGFGQGIVKGNDRIQLRGQRLQLRRQHLQLPLQVLHLPGQGRQPLFQLLLLLPEQLLLLPLLLFVIAQQGFQGAQ
jgi:hypothetical protein